MMGGGWLSHPSYVQAVSVGCKPLYAMGAICYSREFTTQSETVMQYYELRGLSAFT